MDVIFRVIADIAIAAIWFQVGRSWERANREHTRNTENTENTGKREGKTVER